jgi:RimJ/RimL family protein N-acetyltransferase
VPRTVQPVVAPGSMRGRAQPVLDAEGLSLRPWEPTDADLVRSAFADPEIRFWHMRSLDGDGEAEGWIDAWSARWEAEADGSWAVADPSTGGVVGQVGLRSVTLEFGEGQISYWILPPARERGVATAAVGALSVWALEDLGLHRLVIHHSIHNSGSCRVAEKSAFALEGTMRSHLLHADGWHDVHLHARFGSEAGG